MTVESAAGKAARCQETQLERLERTGSREGGQNSGRMARHHHLMSAKHFCFSFFFFFSTEQKGRLEIKGFQHAVQFHPVYRKSSVTA